MNFHQTILPLFQKTRAQWLHEARLTALTVGNWKASQGEPPHVTADDIHRHCPIPDGIDPRVMGAVFTKDGWRKVGYVNSTRAICHHRPIALFEML
jgi:hypothetical protein